MKHIIIISIMLAFFDIFGEQNNFECLPNDMESGNVSKDDLFKTLKNMKCDMLARVRSGIILGEKEALLNTKTGDVDAIKYFRMALDVIEESGKHEEYKKWEYYSFRGLSYVYSNKGASIDDFLMMSEKAYALSKEFVDDKGNKIPDDAMSYNYIIANYRKAQNSQYNRTPLESYEVYLKKALDLANELSKSKSNMYKIYSADISGRIMKEFYNNCSEAVRFYKEVSIENLSNPKFNFVFENMKTGYMFCAENAEKDAVKVSEELKKLGIKESDSDKKAIFKKECDNSIEWYKAAFTLNLDEDQKNIVANRIKRMSSLCQ